MIRKRRDPLAAVELPARDAPTAPRDPAEDGSKEHPYTRRFADVDSRYTFCKCAECLRVAQCTPSFDFFVRYYHRDHLLTPAFDEAFEEGRTIVCSTCFYAYPTGRPQPS